MGHYRCIQSRSRVTTKRRFIPCFVNELAWHYANKISQLAPRPVAGFVVRKEIKDHGTERKIDGNFKPGTTVILFDDVTTKGGSVMQAVRAVRDRGARVAKIITLVDRLEGAGENLGKEGIELLALYTTRDLLG